MWVVESPTACSMHPADLLACSSFKLIEHWLQKSKLCKANYDITHNNEMHEMQEMVPLVSWMRFGEFLANCKCIPLLYVKLHTCICICIPQVSLYANQTSHATDCMEAISSRICGSGSRS